MLRSCVCFGGTGNKRRSSSLEDSSSCRSSEIERNCADTTGRGGGAGGSGASSLLQLFHSRGWYRHWRKPGRALSMTKGERTFKAALLIQLWYRRYRARMEVRRRYTWNIFQSLEYAGENDQVELYNFFNALLTYIPAAVESAAAAADSKDRESPSMTSSSSVAEYKQSVYEDESDDEIADTDPKEDTSFAGPRLSFPLTKKDINSMIELFRKKKKNKLHPKFVGQLLREAAMKLRRLPNLNKASTAVSRRITVIGDLHGKLDDLLVIFHKNGLPSTDNPYVFNGDFVDRGKKGLEVFLLLLACFLAFPTAVFLNRGNHEDAVMNARYGFIREVQMKYLRNADHLLKKIDQVYRWLPLGTIINNRVLVVHGGISDTTNLDLIRSLDRGKYVSILRPPVELKGESIDKTEWKQLFDIMWSDPQNSNGCEPNNLRGAGTYFGPDVTLNFLEKNNLKYLVRSHECKPDGHEYTHHNKVITIFSASNYYAIGSNKGAYLKFDPQLEPYFVQYISAASKSRKLTFRQRVGVIESSAIRGLGVRLREHINELEAEFQRRDPNNTGKITVAQWCESMEKATGLGLAWRMLREKLAPMPADTPPNEVDYHATLELLNTDVFVMAEEEETSVAESLYTHKASLEAIFFLLDKDKSGFITLDEFAEALDLMEKYLTGTHTRDHLLDICKMMDINKDGCVDLNEFLEAFRLCSQSLKRPAEAHSRPSASSLEQITQRRNTVSAVVTTLKQDNLLEAEIEIDPSDYDMESQSINTSRMRSTRREL